MSGLPSQIFQAVAAPAAIVGAVSYLFKLYLDRFLKRQDDRQTQLEKQHEVMQDQLNRRLDQIADTSLVLKKGMRDEERAELVACRVAIAEWEDFLQHAATDYSMLPAQTANIADVYAKDQELFRTLKISTVRVGIYLRDEHLEDRLTTTVLQLQNTYHPLLLNAISALAELQANSLALAYKKAAFEKSDLLDMTKALTEDEGKQLAASEAQMTEVIRTFSEQLIKVYPDIAGHLVDLKQAINAYVYRPLQSTDVDTQ